MSSTVVGKLSPTATLLVPPRAPAAVSLLAAFTDSDGTGQSILGCQIDGNTGRLKVDALITPSGTPLVVTGDKTPADAYANPTDHVGTWSLLGAFDRAANRWARVDSTNLTSVSPITLANGGTALRTAAVLYGQFGAADYRQVSVTSTGFVNCFLGASQALADNVNAVGQPVPWVWTMNAHRNQGGNMYLSRGGYSSAIGGADIPGILNAFATLAYNSSPPAVVSSQAVAAQSDSRGTLLVQLAKPDNTARDTPTRASAVGAVAASLKASAGNLLSVTAHLAEKGEIAVWLLLLDQTTAPVNGQVPVWSEFVPPITGDEGPSSFYEPTRLGREIFSEQGLRFATGIAACFSTTPNVVTLIGATANAVFNATYV